MIDMSVARDDRYDALVQKDRSHRLSIRFLMFDSCLLFVSPDSDLCVRRFLMFDSCLLFDSPILICVSVSTGQDKQFT